MTPLLYSELVDWYDLIDPRADHEPDVARYTRLLTEVIGTGAERTLLELGSGAGNNGTFLSREFRCTLSDLSEQMLALSRRANPGCEHVQGDMRTLRLDRTFDSVLVHDAVMYLTTREDLRAAAKTAFVHTRPGGAALFAPDCVRETLLDHAHLEGEDQADGKRAARFVMWSWDPDPGDDTFVTDFAFLLRDGDQMRAVHDRHVEGVFPRAFWKEALTDAGFEVRSVQGTFEDGAVEDLFVCRRP